MWQDENGNKSFKILGMAVTEKEKGRKYDIVVQAHCIKCTSDFQNPRLVGQLTINIDTHFRLSERDHFKTK